MSAAGGADHPRRPARAQRSYGIDVGGTKVLGVAVSASGAVVASARRPTPQAAVDPTGADPAAAGEHLAATVAEVVRLLHGSAGAAGARYTVGVGLPGLVDESGVLRFSPNMAGATGAGMQEILERRLVAAAPGAAGADAVRIDNDANCATLAELELGAARGVSHCVVVTLGTGIGGGLVMTGRLQTGAHHLGGEVGHMVVDPGGPRCSCGGRGCWEQLASGTGLGRLGRQAARAGSLPVAVTLAGGDPEAVRGEHVTEAARRGDPAALAVLAELGRWVALGLSNLVALLDPERIVLGGGLVEAGEMLLGPVRRTYLDLVEGGEHRPAVDIVPAAFGERAGAIGAAVLGRGALDP